jgi:hypothetical protein
MAVFGGMKNNYMENLQKDGLEAGYINMRGSVTKKNIKNITRDFLTDKITEDSQ